jgi:polyisoprenoid-binding protein YceI
MKRSWILASAAAVLSAAGLFAGSAAWSAPESATWAGDTVHSFVLFKIKHMGASWTYGRFNDFTVSLGMNDAGTEVSSVAFDVKTASVDTGQGKRDDHLRHSDFFNAAKFPSISFKSTAVKPADAETTEVTGDLTLHGVTKPVTVKIARVGEGDMKGTKLVGYESVFTIKRTDFGMDSYVGPAGDDVQITVAVELQKK